ncbi:MAG: RDD family protein, partial [Pseudomonadota bacterium]|nr:RDD family protein [Pseudomonadota bacterium]
VFESSRWQATPGKRALALLVVSSGGKTLTNGHALQRYLASSLSWLSLNLGHVLAALPPKHLALHDRISGTRVVRMRRDARMPAWAWAWLLLQGAATLAAVLWLFTRVQTAMSGAMQQIMGQL